MDCRHARYLLARCIESDIKAEEALELEEHLQACRKCAKDLRLLRKVVSMSSAAEGEEPLAVAEEIMKRIDKKTWLIRTGEFLQRIKNANDIAKIAVLAAGISFGIYFLVVFRPNRLPVEEVQVEPESPGNIFPQGGESSAQNSEEDYAGEPAPPTVAAVRQAPKNRSAREQKTAKKERLPSADEVVKVLDSRIAEAQDRQIIKKPFKDASAIAAKIQKDKKTSVDARALRENLSPSGARGRTEQAEKIVLVVDNLTGSQADIINFAKDLGGSLLSVKDSSIVVYVPSEKYPEFFESVDRQIGGIVRPAAGEYSESVESRDGMVPLNIQLIPKP